MARRKAKGFSYVGKPVEIAKPRFQNDIEVGTNGGDGIIQQTTSTGVGNDLIIKGGDTKSGGTDGAGGDLQFYAGRGTGSAEGGQIEFYTFPAGGGSGTAYNGSARGPVIGSAGAAGTHYLHGGTDQDFAIRSDGNLNFHIDYDNDETSQKFSFNNTATEVANLSEAGTLQLDGNIELGHATDTTIARSSGGVVTIEGNTIKTSADYSYQYISFGFGDLSYVSNTWTTPSQYGMANHTWNNRHGTGGGEPASDAPSAVDGSSTIEIDYLDQGSGIVVPLASQFVGFYANIRTNNTDPITARPVFGVFRASEPANDNTTDLTATVIAFDSYDTASGNRKNRFMKLENFPGSPVALSQGDLLFPAVGLDEAMNDSAGDIIGNATIVLRTLIP